MIIMMDDAETSYVKNKRYIATGFILLLLGIVIVSMFSAYLTIQEKDKAAQTANETFSAHADDLAVKTQYNLAVRDYIMVTRQFPGNLVGPITGYPKDKWVPTMGEQDFDQWMKESLQPSTLDSITGGKQWTI